MLADGGKEMERARKVRLAKRREKNPFLGPEDLFRDAPEAQESLACKATGTSPGPASPHVC